MKKDSFEDNYSNEINELNKLFSNLDENNSKQPNIEQVRNFVRVSRAEIEEKRKRNYNIFRGIALATVSILVPAMHFYPFYVLSLSLLSMIIMPILLVFSKEEN